MIGSEEESQLELGPDLFLDLEREVTRENMVAFLLDERGRSAFLAYLQGRHCEENLLCWIETREFAHLREDRDLLKDKAQQIFNKYVEENGAHCLTLSFQLRQEIETAMKAEITLATFVKLEKAAFLTMIHGTFDNFLTTDDFAQFKKRILHGDDKKPCCTLI